ncbi:LysR family transcriptional regulator [Reyranella sp. CPCC 100927]|uniref:LysR family transcriptional regulator n=1 Tax=Reyranella sp. CPCC 100927 TaxID=2599616 RepID=UPI0011B78A47|nr:LysR family transcriptional regulator [Reyranella sp. CPCC 100927]TWT12623.1 LysR family transcriptional regulator [Reyranella sp. CPCC 100927]
MQAPGTPTLDQIQVFLTVVETGSFAAAARQLGRATSAVSYAVGNLEAQLGLALFDRESTKRPQLTEAGRAILADARTVSLGLGGLQAKARGLLAGLEAEVVLAVDVMLSTERLVAALQAFQAAFPTVALRLHVEALGYVAQLVLDGTANVGISGPLHRTIDGLERRRISSIELIPVAAPTHRLAGIKGPQMAALVRNELQLVLTDRSPLTAGQDFAVLSVRTWRLADLGAKHALLLAGLGWGNMPEPMVRADLAAGRLVHLALCEWQGGPYPLEAIHRIDRPPGPAAQWLIERLAD